MTHLSTMRITVPGIQEVLVGDVVDANSKVRGCTQVYQLDLVIFLTDDAILWDGTQTKWTV